MFLTEASRSLYGKIAQLLWTPGHIVTMTDAAATVPTSEQQQRAKWDLLLADIEYRQEQLHQARHYEPWRLAFAGMTAGAALFAAGAAFVKVFGG